MGHLEKYLTANHYQGKTPQGRMSFLGREFEQHVLYDDQVFGLFELCRWEVKHSWNLLQKRPTASEKGVFHNL